jgi:hypothetical protein
LCYSVPAFVALVSPFVEAPQDYNLRPFLFPTRFPRCLGEYAKDARLPSRFPEKSAPDSFIYLKGIFL